MSLVPSLLQAIVRANGEALVMHAGDKPYVVSPTGQVELASRGLTLEAVNGIVAQLLPRELLAALDEFGAVQCELPTLRDLPGEHFTVVAARGGNDIWAEIRRRRLLDDDVVPEELFGPSASPPSAALVAASTAAAAVASPLATPHHPAAPAAGAAASPPPPTRDRGEFIADDGLEMPPATHLWAEPAAAAAIAVGSLEPEVEPPAASPKMANPAMSRTPPAASPIPPPLAVAATPPVSVPPKVTPVPVAAAARVVTPTAPPAASGVPAAPVRPAAAVTPPPPQVAPVQVVATAPLRATPPAPAIVAQMPSVPAPV